VDSNLNVSDFAILATCIEDFLSLETYTARNPTHIGLIYLKFTANFKIVRSFRSSKGPD
jgi:hypothetical protein